MHKSWLRLKLRLRLRLKQQWCGSGSTTHALRCSDKAVYRWKLGSCCTTAMRGPTPQPTYIGLASTTTNLRRIKQNHVQVRVGEPLYHSYARTYTTTNLRRIGLFSGKHFGCECIRYRLQSEQYPCGKKLIGSATLLKWKVSLSSQKSGKFKGTLPWDFWP
jgi:hypothetical protein